MVRTGPGAESSGLPDLHYDMFRQRLDVYVDATPTLGGTWEWIIGADRIFVVQHRHASDGDFDDTFSLVSGQIEARGANINARGLAAGTAIGFGGGFYATLDRPSTVTLIQTDTRLTLLVFQDCQHAQKLPQAADRTLRIEDLKLTAASSRLDVGDNVFIDGNSPGFMQPGVTPGTPKPVPTNSDQIRGDYNGTPLTVNSGVDPNASLSRGVAFANGGGLAGYYPAGTFHGVMFDSNDFVYYPTVRGDTDLDRDVDFEDLLRIAMRYRTTNSLGVVGGNVDNPAVANGSVDFNDLLLLAQNYGAAYAMPATRPPLKIRKPVADAVFG